MSVRIWQSVQCQSCRYTVLETFASLAGVSLRPAIQYGRPFSTFQSPKCRMPMQQKALFSVQARLSSGRFDETSQEQTENAPLNSTTSTISVPWYLQVDAPIPPAPSNPLLERQILPTVPPDAPPILSPMLNYLSETAGLDNLLLLDLRSLDPPPALGANLMMLIGTARSVKHLNVSADRFCRWCRSNYKLRPYADGLLGRNELKLKLRRKARRQKLAQSVGNTLEQNRDDGITTGWICVNVGPVDQAVMAATAEDQRTEEHGSFGVDVKEEDEDKIEEDEEEEYENPEENYSGFGSRSTAPRIVVQMFTEEKRLEMDLEGLWEVRTLRRANKDEKGDLEIRTSDSSIES